MRVHGTSGKAARIGCIGFIACLGLAAAVHAQGGPPLVSDDPETPGDGHWEIDLASIETSTPAGRQLAFPDVDINYGWGDHVQLKADVVPWSFAQTPGRGRAAGPGAGNFGVKWRFLDREQGGFALSTYPQYLHSLLPSSTRRGLAAPGRQLLLPLEAATEIGGFGLDVEIGRNFVENGASQWEQGIVGAHACAAGVECLVELHETLATAGGQQPGHAHQTLLNFGLRWKLEDSVNLLFAAGREFGTRADDQARALVYLGLQFTR